MDRVSRRGGDYCAAQVLDRHYHGTVHDHRSPVRRAFPGSDRTFRCGRCDLPDSHLRGELCGVWGGYDALAVRNHDAFSSGALLRDPSDTPNRRIGSLTYNDCLILTMAANTTQPRLLKTVTPAAIESPDNKAIASNTCEMLYEYIVGEPDGRVPQLAISSLYRCLRRAGRGPRTGARGGRHAQSVEGDQLRGVRAPSE